MTQVFMPLYDNNSCKDSFWSPFKSCVLNLAVHGALHASISATSIVPSAFTSTAHALRISLTVMKPSKSVSTKLKKSVKVCASAILFAVNIILKVIEYTNKQSAAFSVLFCMASFILCLNKTIDFDFYRNHLLTY